MVYGARMAMIIRFLRPYKRIIVFSLAFVYCTFRLIHPSEEGRFFDLLFFSIVVIFVASQLFWIRRLIDLGERFIPGNPPRAWLAFIVWIVYLFCFLYSFTHLGVVHQAIMGHIAGPADPRLRSVLIEAVFSWWLVGSWLGFCLVMVFWALDRVACAAA